MPWRHKPHCCRFFFFFSFSIEHTVTTQVTCTHKCGYRPVAACRALNPAKKIWKNMDFSGKWVVLSLSILFVNKPDADSNINKNFSVFCQMHKHKVFQTTHLSIEMHTSFMVRNVNCIYCRTINVPFFFSLLLKKVFMHTRAYILEMSFDFSLGC